MIDKVVQIANLVQGGRFDNPQRGRLYSAKGNLALHRQYGGREQRTEVSMDNAKVKIRYALGRTNHGPDGRYGTSKFHVNPYFSCVTAIQMSNRRQWIVEIK